MPRGRSLGDHGASERHADRVADIGKITWNRRETTGGATCDPAIGTTGDGIEIEKIDRDAAMDRLPNHRRRDESPQRDHTTVLGRIENRPGDPARRVPAPKKSDGRPGTDSRASRRRGTMIPTAWAEQPTVDGAVGAEEDDLDGRCDLGESFRDGDSGSHRTARSAAGEHDSRRHRGRDRHLRRAPPWCRSVDPRRRRARRSGRFATPDDPSRSAVRARRP